MKLFDCTTKLGWSGRSRRISTQMFWKLVWLVKNCTRTTWKPLQEHLAGEDVYVSLNTVSNILHEGELHWRRGWRQHILETGFVVRWNEDRVVRPEWCEIRLEEKKSQSARETPFLQWSMVVVDNVMGWVFCVRCR